VCALPREPQSRRPSWQSARTRELRAALVREAVAIVPPISVERETMLPRGRVRQQSELEFFVIFVPGAYLLRALRGLSSSSSHVRDDAPSLDGHHDVEQVVDVGERVAIDEHHVGKLAR